MCQRENLSFPSFLKHVKLSELEFLITVVTRIFIFLQENFFFSRFFLSPEEFNFSFTTENIRSDINTSFSHAVENLCVL